MRNISNKSEKYSLDRESIDITSYRLMTVCIENNRGNVQSIVEKINKRMIFIFNHIILKTNII
jgi:hypothetical protein